MELGARLEPTLSSALAEDAVTAFSKALEVELRNRVFKAARVDLAPKSPRATGSLDRSQPEHRFLLYVNGKEKLRNLGDMYRVLDATRSSRLGLSVELNAWLTKAVPGWDRLVQLLGELLTVRNPAAHADEGGTAAHYAHDRCRGAIEILTKRS